MQNEEPAVCVLIECPDCGSPLAVRVRQRDQSPFWGCTGFPDCRWTAPYLAALQHFQAQLDEASSQERAFFAARPAPGLPPALETVFRQVLLLYHPDKWKDSLVATDITKAVLALRAATLKK